MDYIIPEMMVLGESMDSASVDRLLAYFHTLQPNYHSQSYISVLLQLVDYEATA